MTSHAACFARRKRRKVACLPRAVSIPSFLHTYHIYSTPPVRVERVASWNLWVEQWSNDCLTLESIPPTRILYIAGVQLIHGRVIPYWHLSQPQASLQDSAHARHPTMSLSSAATSSDGMTELVEMVTVKSRFVPYTTRAQPRVASLYMYRLIATHSVCFDSPSSCGVIACR